MTVDGYFGTMVETALKYTRNFSDFRLSYERQILPMGVIMVDFFLDANSHGGVDGGATVAFVSEVKKCHRFFLYIA